jgi:N-acetylglutamate synthase-like GNAT family acetyltransferase
MYTFYYYTHLKYDEYSDYFKSIGFIDGNKDYLLSQVENNKKFCRNQEGIDYNGFVESMKQDDYVIYITPMDSEEILGACSISINSPYYIMIQSICVPKNEYTGIGSLLLLKIKELTTTMGIFRIILSAEPPVQEFYIKNGYVRDLDNEDEENLMFLRIGKGKIHKKNKKHSQKKGKYHKTFRKKRRNSSYYHTKKDK